MLSREAYHLWLAIKKTEESEVSLERIQEVAPACAITPHKGIVSKSLIRQLVRAGKLATTGPVAQGSTFQVLKK